MILKILILNEHFDCCGNKEQVPAYKYYIKQTEKNTTKNFFFYFQNIMSLIETLAETGTQFAPFFEPSGIKYHMNSQTNKWPFYSLEKIVYNIAVVNTVIHNNSQPVIQQNPR